MVGWRHVRDADLVDAYLAWVHVATEFGVDSQASRPMHWASDELRKAVDEDPRRALRVITAAVAAAPNDRDLALIAAGPLEDLLCLHGVQVIDDVERLAANDDRFRRALSGVWGDNRMVPAVWARVDAAVGDMPRL
jgi:hypothetical protein